MAFLCSGTLNSTPALCSGAVLNSKITNKKNRNVKNMVLNRPHKGHLFTIQAETCRQNVALFDLNWEGACWGLKCFTTLYKSVKDHLGAMSTDLGLSILLQRWGHTREKQQLTFLNSQEGGGEIWETICINERNRNRVSVEDFDEPFQEHSTSERLPLLSYIVSGLGRWR